MWRFSPRLRTSKLFHPAIRFGPCSLTSSSLVNQYYPAPRASTPRCLNLTITPRHLLRPPPPPPPPRNDTSRPHGCPRIRCVHNPYWLNSSHEKLPLAASLPLHSNNASWFKASIVRPPRLPPWILDPPMAVTAAGRGRGPCPPTCQRP